MEVIGVYFSTGGLLLRRYNILVAVSDANKKELDRIFGETPYSIHQMYGNSAELTFFKVNHKKAKTIADKLRELEFSKIGQFGYSRLLKALE